MILVSYLKWQQFVQIPCNKIPKVEIAVLLMHLSFSSGSHIISFYLFTIYVVKLKTDRAHVLIRGWRPHYYEQYYSYYRHNHLHQASPAHPPTHTHMQQRSFVRSFVHTLTPHFNSLLQWPRFSAIQNFPFHLFLLFLTF